MKLSASDLIPGMELIAPNQGTNITPTFVKVRIYWVGPDSVHYQIHGSSKVEETTLERFLEIINQKP